MRWNPRDALDLGATERSGERRAGFATVLSRLRPPASAVVGAAGFWTAVVLPLCYVPLLLTGLETARDAALLASLVLLHLLALTAGHAHNRS
jgi:hypothetical protein